MSKLGNIDSIISLQYTLEQISTCKEDIPLNEADSFNNGMPETHHSSTVPKLYIRSGIAPPTSYKERSAHQKGKNEADNE